MAGQAARRRHARPPRASKPRVRTPPRQRAPLERAPRHGRVAVGRINSPWGLRGHVKVTPLTENAARIQPGAVLLVRGEPRTVLDVRYPKGYPCVMFEGYEDPNAANALRGTLIEIEETELPELAEGEFYVHDLIGLEVVNTDGDRIGALAEVLRTGANDVYIVRRRGERDLLLPAIPDVIVEVDPAGGRMVVELLPGLLDGGSSED